MSRCLAAIAVVLASCAAPSLPPSPTPVETLLLLRQVGDVCRLSTLPPRPLTFRIDTAAAWPQGIVAVDAGGEPHDVLWPEGFTGGTALDPVVRDPAGEVVARDGEVFAHTEEDARLHGYLVCSGRLDEIYILLPGREQDR